MCILGCRELHCDLEASGVMGVGPVHALPSTCLEKVEEQPEDADNQRNVTRMGSQPSDLSTTVHIPVMLTGLPGETTVVPSEYLPTTSGQGPPCAGSVCSPPFPPAPWQPPGDGACLCELFPNWKVFAVSICASISLCFAVPRRSTTAITCHLSSSLLPCNDICKLPGKCQAWC